MRGIAGQIELLGQMKNFISDLSDKFEDILKTQEGFVKELDSEGLEYKILQNFEESVLENREKTPWKLLKFLLKNLLIIKLKLGNY